MKETFPALSKFAEDDLVKGEREKIAKNPDLRTLYSDIIEQNNFDRLREKSELQLYNLKTRYFGDLHPEDNEFAQKEEKIREFTQFVENLIPVRVDPNEYDEYISPERSGNIKSFGPQDILVRSDQFVYGSFAEIGHLMSQGRNQRLLDIDDIAPRAQIVMQDIANIVARVGGDQSAVEKYLLNLFDWENGKKILAFYLASVFDTTQQAMDALSGTGGNPQIAQRWENMFTYYNRSFKPKSTEEFLAQKSRDEEQTLIFRERMQKMLENTGIEPPLSIEIRVKDTAKTAK